MKTPIVASLLTCLLLPAVSVAGTPGGAPFADPDRTLVVATQELQPNETNPITDEESAMVLGTGWKSDFWCGAATGAGFVMSATGILTPVGVGLATAGIYCALYM